MILAAYTAPNGASTAYDAPAAVELAHGTLCNRSASSVNVTVAVEMAGGPTIRAISAFPLAAGDTLQLSGYLAGALLGEGDGVQITVTAANAVDVLITGREL